MKIRKKATGNLFAEWQDLNILMEKLFEKTNIRFQSTDNLLSWFSSYSYRPELLKLTHKSLILSALSWFAFWETRGMTAHKLCSEFSPKAGLSFESSPTKSICVNNSLLSYVKCGERFCWYLWNLERMINGAIMPKSIPNVLRMKAIRIFISEWGLKVIKWFLIDRCEILCHPIHNSIYDCEGQRMRLGVMGIQND